MLVMNDLAIARAVHVLAVVIWIGGVGMVTTVILPMVRRARMPTEGQALLEAVERRFIWQARIATLLVAASGFYMVERLDLWDRFRDIEFWWMHAMVLLWLIFTLVLFIGEPCFLCVRAASGSPIKSTKVKISHSRTMACIHQNSMLRKRSQRSSRSTI